MAKKSKKPPKPPQFHVRWLIRRDMPEVLRIEQDSFADPWEEDDFVRVLKNRNCIGKIIEVQDRVIGYMIYEMHKTRLHVLNFAIAPDMQRKKAGTELANRLIAALSEERRTRVVLEVREGNLGAQCFFRAMGFRAVNVLRKFYQHTDEDAYVFQYRLTSTKTA